ncbi:hypothetical protein VP01_30g14 [Puccinia sorghi]|uniref:Uncharacterized protein n=1 Tax=Puccinia sorghi TaxID=27349 RepID=A0A0L6UZF1_9BASI|nr:hypothetical protein VP01_30g14 [Puccinia sorghi]
MDTSGPRKRKVIHPSILLALSNYPNTSRLPFTLHQPLYLLSPLLFRRIKSTGTTPVHPRGSRSPSTRSLPDSHRIPVAGSSVAQAVEQQRAEVARLFADAFRRTGNTASAEERRIETPVANQPSNTGISVPVVDPIQIIPNLDPALAALGSTQNLARPLVLSSTHSNADGASTINIQRNLTRDNLRAFDQDRGRETQTVQGASDQDSIELITDVPGPQSLPLPVPAISRGGAPLPGDLGRATQFILSSHLAFREQYLLAQAANNLAAMGCKEVAFNHLTWQFVDLETRFNNLGRRFF